MRKQGDSPQKNASAPTPPTETPSAPSLFAGLSVSDAPQQPTSAFSFISGSNSEPAQVKEAAPAPSAFGFISSSASVPDSEPAETPQVVSTQLTPSPVTCMYCIR